jgi:hypothetical protein
MKPRLVILLLLIIGAAEPALSQDRLYPVRGDNKNVPTILTSDRSAIVVEKAFHHKLTIGSPSNDRASFHPDTEAPLVVLWLRIQNVSRNPISVDVTTFTGTDDDGRVYSGLALEEASKRIIAGISGGSLGTKALRGISLGRAANSPTEEDAKEDVVRYALHSGQIQPGVSKEGFIYFERPARKKFTTNIRLGDLWSQPLVFSTEKQR